MGALPNRLIACILENDGFRVFSGGFLSDMPPQTGSIPLADKSVVFNKPAVEAKSVGNGDEGGGIDNAAITACYIP